MSAIEFAEWVAYARMYPFGEGREDARAGVIASAIVNVHRKKGSKPRSWQDFFPPFVKRRAKPDWRGLLAKVTALNTQLGGVDKRKTPAEE